MKRITKIENIRSFTNNKAAILYGNGPRGREILTIFRENNIKVAGFANSSKPHEDICLGIDVWKFSEIKDKEKYAWFISADWKYHSEIEKMLNQNGITEVAYFSRNFFREYRHDILSRNKELTDFERKDRCFVLAAGPSLTSQNLSLLKGEDIISGTFLPLIDTLEDIHPKYYYTPASCADWGSCEEYCRETLEFIDIKSTSEYIFLDYLDRPYIKYLNLLKNRKVIYMSQDGNFSKNRKQIYEFDKNTPGCSRGIAMALKIAIALRYKEIYIMGMDFDFWQTGTYKLCYDVGKLKDLGLLNIWKTLTQDRHFDEKYGIEYRLMAQVRAYNQLFALKKTADANDIKIYNATNGGFVDMFPRKKYEELF